MSVELDKATGQIYDEDHKEFCIDKYTSIRSTAESEKDAIRAVQRQFALRFKDDNVPDVDRLTRWIRDHTSNKPEDTIAGGRTRASRRAAAEAAKKLIEISSDSDEEESEPEVKRPRKSVPLARNARPRRQDSSDEEAYNPRRDNVVPAMSSRKKGSSQAISRPQLQQAVQMIRSLPQKFGSRTAVPSARVVSPSKPSTSSASSSSKELELLRHLKDSKISKPLRHASLNLLRAVETAAAHSGKTNVTEILKKVIQSQNSQTNKNVQQNSSRSLTSVSMTSIPSTSAARQQTTYAPQTLSNRPVQPSLLDLVRSSVRSEQSTSAKPDILKVLEANLRANGPRAQQFSHYKIGPNKPATQSQAPQPSRYAAGLSNCNPSLANTTMSRQSFNAMIKVQIQKKEQRDVKPVVQPVKENNVRPNQSGITDLEREIYEGIISLKGITLDMECEEIVNSDDENDDCCGDFELKEKPQANKVPKPEYIVSADAETGSLDMSCEEIQAEPLELYCHRDKLTEMQARIQQKEEAAYKFYLNTKEAYEKAGATFTFMDASKAQPIITGGSNVRMVQNLTNQPVRTSHPVYLKPPPGSTSSAPLILPAGSYIIQIPQSQLQNVNQTFRVNK